MKVNKAFILGAGMGLRMRPITNNQPKPMAEILGRPLIDYGFEFLAKNGVNNVVVNTHYCAGKYKKFFKNKTAFGQHLSFVHEPVLLDTGGGLKNVEKEFQNGTFVMMNGDSLYEGSLKGALAFHKEKRAVATMILSALHGPKHVAINHQGLVIDIRAMLGAKRGRYYTFTGIHILEKEVFNFIPAHRPVSIIQIYLNMIRGGAQVHGYVWGKGRWLDVGHVGIYHLLNNGFYAEGAPNFLKRQKKAPQVRNLLSCNLALQPRLRSLDGDGSDRSYYRVRQGKISRIIMTYGLEKEENAYFPKVARFLERCGLDVARIYHSDPKYRIVTLEDLGDVSLWKIIQRISDKDQIIEIYKRVLDMMAQLHIEGHRLYCKKPFKISPPFSRKLYLWEAEYFKEYFLNRHMKVHWTKRLEVQFKNVTERLAQDLSKEQHVLIHRDFQSKNIMIKNNKPYLIDFQGMRLGLGQYDLASLLYDPYVDLTESTRGDLLDYYINMTRETNRLLDHHHFLENFKKATIQRLMQALGAYAFLWHMKGKRNFLTYIPTAMKRLKSAMRELGFQADFLELSNKEAVEKEWLSSRDGQ